MQKVTHHSRKNLAWIGVLLVFFALFYATFINLATADLGRHIVNGRELLTTPNTQAVLTSNYYSYSNSEYTFINHHWLYGVLSFSIYRFSGFVGLSIFNILTATTAFGLLIFWAYRKYGLVAAYSAGLLCLPLLTSRTEVRPETISLVGVALYFVVLERFLAKKISSVWVWILLLTTQVVWQNTHLFFVLGLFELFVFWLASLMQKQKSAIISLGLLGVVSALVTLLNPNGIPGALMPLTIFSNYGYSVAENQTLLFMLERFKAPLQYYELFLVLIGVGGGLLAFRHSKKSSDRTLFFTTAVLFFVLGSATFRVIRLESFWGLLSIPYFAFLVAHFGKKVSLTKLRISATLQMLGSTIGFAVLLLIGWSGLFTPLSARTGLGLLPGVSGAAEFITSEQLSGPIFNNYDIGGYILFYLFPSERVFIDNRPEAYPVHFFEDEYMQPQESNQEWQALQAKYHFNLIVFYRHDLTPWAQKFLIARIDDPQWAPVFVDATTIIFLKKTPENAETIEKLQLP